MTSWLLAAVILFSGCGATARERATNTAHEALNVLTDAVDPAYGLAVAACDARGQLILARSDTTFEQDSADLQSLQAECNAAFEVFENIRELQERARRILDGIERGDALALLVEARGLWQAVKQRLERAGLLRAEAPRLQPWSAR